MKIIGILLIIAGVLGILLSFGYTGLAISAIGLFLGIGLLIVEKKLNR